MRRMTSAAIGDLVLSKTSKKPRLAYLRDVLERIVSGETKANQLDTLLPWNWNPSEPAASAQAA